MVIDVATTAGTTGVALKPSEGSAVHATCWAYGGRAPVEYTSSHTVLQVTVPMPALHCAGNMSTVVADIPPSDRAIVQRSSCMKCGRVFLPSVCKYAGHFALPHGSVACVLSETSGIAYNGFDSELPPVIVT